MEFNTVAANKVVLKKFLQNKRMTVTEALRAVKGTSLEASMNWLKKINEVTKGIKQCSPEDVAKIKKQPTIIAQLKQLTAATKKILS